MNKNVLKVFIGFDPVETVAWHAMAHSILSQASVPVALVPINLRNLKNIYTRPRDAKQSNEFSISRFLVPYLADFKGFAVFFDCDMMLRCDLAEILQVVQAEPGKAVYVVQHSYEPRDDVKYLDTVQYRYPRKNWSSVVLWDCEHPANRVVDLDYVHKATPLELHRFAWLKDEQIGSLDIRWNWLVGEYDEPPKDVKNVHWTLGGPYFNEYSKVDFSNEWRAIRSAMLHCLQREPE